MKTILSFIDWYAPGYKAGGTVRAFQNMISFLQEDFTFYIVTRNTDYTETKPYEGIPSNEWITVDKNIHIYYASADQIGYKSWNKIIHNVSYDTLYIHGIFSYWFSILPLYLNKRHQNKKAIVAAHGMLGDHAFDVKPLKKNLFLTTVKLSGLYKNVVFHAANADEASDILKRVGKDSRVIIANELPMNQELGEGIPIKKEKGTLKLVFLGRISPEKNLKFGLEILKETTSGIIKLDIYGPIYNESYWQECKLIIDQFPERISAKYKASLPANKVLGMLQEYHALFLPTSGENFGHAILECFMSGRPVIISDQTPWKNLTDHGAGYDLPLQDKEVFTQAIMQMVEKEQLEFNELVKNTHQYIAGYINNPSGLQENINLFKSE